MSKHQKSISAPKTFVVKRKEGSWSIKPSSGPHSAGDCIPLGIILRDILGYADSIGEVKEILNEGKCKVDGRVIKDYRFPLGIFDSLALGERFYRLVPHKEGFKLIEIDEGEGTEKLCRVEDKKMVEGGEIQLNLNDGRNILTDNDEIETGDSLLLSLPDLEIKEVVKIKEGSKVIVTEGKNKGKTAEVKRDKTVEGMESNRTVIERDGKEIDLPEKLIFPIGEDEPLIKIE